MDLPDILHQYNGHERLLFGRSWTTTNHDLHIIRTQINEDFEIYSTPDYFAYRDEFEALKVAYAAIQNNQFRDMEFIASGADGIVRKFGNFALKLFHTGEDYDHLQVAMDTVISQQYLRNLGYLIGDIIGFVNIKNKLYQITPYHPFPIAGSLIESRGSLSYTLNKNWSEIPNIDILIKIKNEYFDRSEDKLEKALFDQTNDYIDHIESLSLRGRNLYECGVNEIAILDYDSNTEKFKFLILPDIQFA